MNSKLPFHFDSSFRRLPEFFHEQVRPTPLREPQLAAVSDSCLRLLDLDPATLDRDFLRDWLNGTQHIPGEQRIASRYAGHQFGSWAGQLGDGRALSLGEVINSKGERWEIQTKGSGKTPFSRFGDGKAVIRSSVREFLCSEHMHALGIPTTRAMALITGADPVVRETIERSALVARVFPTNIRFGHFEMAHHFEKPQELEALVKMTREIFFPAQASVEEMLEEILTRNIRLVAQWQGMGFCHGVLNTDNMSILGITFDYGPFGFLEETDLNFVCNHSDHEGRYSYWRQPEIVFWNLDRLFQCFVPFVARERLKAMLETFPARFENEFFQIFRRKLGLREAHESDVQLISRLLQLLHGRAWDFSFFFRRLGDYQQGHPDSMEKFWKFYANHPEFTEWLEAYDQRLHQESSVDADRHQHMSMVNPALVLKNALAQQIIQDVEADRFDSLERALKVLGRPFHEPTDFAEFAGPAPADRRRLVVSCSS